MSAVTRIAGLILLFFSSQSLAAYKLNMDPGVTSFSQGAYDIHQIVMWICVAIGIVVFGAMIYSIIFHRKSRGFVAADFHESTTMEIIWTVVPFLILIAMAIPATTILLDMEDNSNSDLSIKVTGYQWKWHYDYNVGQDPQEISFFSNISTPDAVNLATNRNVIIDEYYLQNVDNMLVIPTNKKVRFLFTANDVIHSWWVPAFGLKQDTIPGYINEGWIKVDKPGIYRGKCTELCGTNHGFMPIVVDVKSEADYSAWLDSQKTVAAEAVASSSRTWTRDELMEHGKEVYATSCGGCHQANGAGIPNVFPGLKGSAIAMGDISKHLDVVINGVSGTVMQAFGGQMNDADLAAVITYERNAWGNDTGDVTQPSDVKAARQ